MTTNPTHLDALRAELKNRGLAGFIIPLTDEHMSEYVGDYAQRLAWATGFTGSAGNGVVMADSAAVFVDGRYTIQVAAEVDGDHVERHHFQEYPLLKWVKDHVKAGDKVGYDPELATRAWVKNTEIELNQVGAELVSVNKNPIDSVWHDRPSASLAPLKVQSDQYAGVSPTDKASQIAAILQKKGADAAVIAMLDSVAWAFNIRAKDVANTPVPHAFAIMKADETAQLFVDPEKVTDAVREHLGNRVEILPRTAFYKTLAAMKGKKVLVDPVTNNAKILSTLQKNGAILIDGQDPCIMPKACKNDVELNGTRNAHIRDGAAIVEFLAWLSVEAPKGQLTEISAADKLWSIRSKRELLQDTSFDTISGAGSNGAICHYRVDAESNRAINVGELYLVDSGGQYFDGTTDITRTIAVGEVGKEEKDRFTRVLKGHIALATARFPVGTAGAALDTIARKPLWDVGLDYDHGTGHGVGSYLAVHEGPQRIAKGSSDVPLKPGMILSNEPGYYKAEAYGIRIENLVIVRKEAGEFERDMLSFETITLAPIDQNLIDIDLLNTQERDWLNAYHARVRETLMPLVTTEIQPWLVKATQAL